MVPNTALPPVEAPALPPGHLAVWTCDLKAIAAVIAGRASPWPADSAFSSGRNPWSYLEGQRTYVQILLAQRPLFEAAWRRLTIEEQQALRTSGVLRPAPPAPRARGRLRVVACGYEDIASGCFIGPEDLPAYFAGHLDLTTPAPTRQHARQIARPAQPMQPHSGRAADALVFGQVPPAEAQSRRRSTPRRR